MRVLAFALTSLVLAGCSSPAPDTPAPRSAASTTSSATTTTTTAPGKEVWSSELQAASPREKCQGADAFTPACAVAMEQFASTVERLAKTVASSGGKYVDAGLKALEVRDAARKWNDECITEPPDVRSKRGCLQALFAANNGDDAILAEVYAAEATR